MDNDLLTKALIATAKKRGSINLLNEGELILKEVFADNSSYKHWTRYQVKYIYANDISWKEIETSVMELWSALGKVDLNLKI